MNKLLLILSAISFLFFCSNPLLVFLFMVCILKSVKRRKDINGQKILITGAGAGVGRQLAIQFSKHSTCLLLLDIDYESLLGTQKLLDPQSTVFLYQCDVSKPEMVYQVADRIKKESGEVDILINNAGILYGKRLLDLSDDNIVKTMQVNALAHFWLCRSFLHSMMAKNRGHIVSIASIMGKATGPHVTDYCSSKFAAVGFAEALEMELYEQKMDGISVTIVCTSQIDTELSQGMNIPWIGCRLTPQYAAEEIVKGILEEQETIYLPHWFGCMFIFKEIVPRWFMLWFVEKTGAIRSMDNFKGRNEKLDVAKNGNNEDPIIKKDIVQRIFEDGIPP